MVPVAQNQRSPPEGKGKGKGQKHKITYCKGKDLFLPGKEKRHLFIIFAVIFDFFLRKTKLIEIIFVFLQSKSNHSK